MNLKVSVLVMRMAQPVKTLGRFSGTAFKKKKLIKKKGRRAALQLSVSVERICTTWQPNVICGKKQYEPCAAKRIDWFQ